MVIVMVKRLLSHKSIFLPDRSHIHFVLIDNGLNVPFAVLIITIISEIFAILAFVINKNQFISQLIIVFLIYNFFLIIKTRKLLNLKSFR